MTECPHLKRTKTIDRLGLMTEKPDGSISAPVLAWHERCDHCHEIVAVHEDAYGSGEQVLLPAASRVALKAEPTPKRKKR